MGASPAKVRLYWSGLASPRQTRVRPWAIAADRLRIASEPGDRADRARGEQESVGEPGALAQAVARQLDGDGDAREVVVAEGRMADVGGDQDLLVALALDPELAVAERARSEARVDADLVARLGQRVALALREAEAPGVVVVGGAVGNPVRVLGERVQVRRRALRAAIRRGATGTL